MALVYSIVSLFQGVTFLVLSLTSGSISYESSWGLAVLAELLVQIVYIMILITLVPFFSVTVNNTNSAHNPVSFNHTTALTSGNNESNEVDEL
jgi:hypothetical protein